MPANVVNLTVHGVGKPRRPLDPGEDEYWVTVEQFEQVLDAVVGIENVRITFDDGNESDVEIALPRLLERRLTAEFFVLAGRLGERGRVDRDGVRELAAAGMTIGSHGWSHCDWRRLDDRHTAQELTEAPKLLSELARMPVRRAAVPFGAYDRRLLAKLRKAGMTRVYTDDGGSARESTWLQPRNSLRHDLGPLWIEDVLLGVPGLRRSASRAAARFIRLTRFQSWSSGNSFIGK
jgi:peptidoglycan/xylan/chitin deacetylase (PgdA/CDA1 family)